MVPTVLDTPVQSQSGLGGGACSSTLQEDTSDQTAGFIADLSHKPQARKNPRIWVVYLKIVHLSTVSVY